MMDTIMQEDTVEDVHRIISGLADSEARHILALKIFQWTAALKRLKLCRPC